MLITMFQDIRTTSRLSKAITTYTELDTNCYSANYFSKQVFKVVLIHSTWLTYVNGLELYHKPRYS